MAIAVAKVWLSEWWSLCVGTVGQDGGRGYTLTVAEEGLLFRMVVSANMIGTQIPSNATVAARRLRINHNEYLKLLKSLADKGLVTVGDTTVEPNLGVAVRLAIERKALPSATRAAVLNKTGGICVYCGAELTVESGCPNSYHVDHVLPVQRGGNDDVANLVPSCATCNGLKRSKTALAFMVA